MITCISSITVYTHAYKFLYIFREKYAVWKAVCRKMVPTIGSGKFITTPIINDDGTPIADPSNNTNYGVSNCGPSDEREIQWKLTLPQIGSCWVITYFSP